MALKECKECGKEVSTKAKSCPNCGAIVNNKQVWLTYLVVGFLLLIFIESLRNKNHKTCETSEQTSAESQPSRQASKIY